MSDTHETVHLHPGAEVRQELRVPRGTILQGRVIDAEGEPVAEAAIFVSRESKRLSPLRVARSDAGGWFTVADTDVTRARWIWARHDFQGPSAAERVPHTEPGVPLDLQLRCLGGERAFSIHGRVIDVRGGVVAGTELGLGPRRIRVAGEEAAGGERHGGQPLGPRTLTGQRGRFSFRGATLGEIRQGLWVRCGDSVLHYPISLRGLRLDEEVKIVLPRLGIIEGVVQSSCGNARVSAEADGVDPTKVMTDQNGCYTVEVPFDRDVALVAWDSSGALARTTLEHDPTAGRRVWNPVLDAPDMVMVQLLPEAWAQGVEGYRVQMNWIGEQGSKSAWSVVDGASFECPPDAPRVLDVLFFTADWRHCLPRLCVREASVDNGRLVLPRPVDDAQGVLTVQLSGWSPVSQEALPIRVRHLDSGLATQLLVYPTRREGQLTRLPSGRYGVRPWRESDVLTLDCAEEVIVEIEADSSVRVVL